MDTTPHTHIIRGHSQSTVEVLVNRIAAHLQGEAVNADPFRDPGIMGPLVVENAAVENEATEEGSLTVDLGDHGVFDIHIQRRPF